jgi:protease-4
MLMQQSYGRELASVITKSAFTVITFLIIITLTISVLTVQFDDQAYISDGSCNIAVLPIEGIILPYTGFEEFDLITTPELVHAFMDAAEEDENIDAVLVEINTPGGTPVASHRIAERLNVSSLPVVGLIGDIGASGGYMVSAATDFLIASAMSDVGGIGVNMSYVEQSKQNEEEGLTYVQLITGEFKDIGSPDRPITQEERDILQRDLDIIHNEFIDIISDYRELPRDQVVALADGASRPGARAIEFDLVDALGDRPEATAALAGFTDKDMTDIEFCEYDRGFLLF